MRRSVEERALVAAYRRRDSAELGRHLCTPLSIAVISTDGSSYGGELFALACGVWVADALLLWIRRRVGPVARFAGR